MYCMHSWLKLFKVKFTFCNQETHAKPLFFIAILYGKISIHLYHDYRMPKWCIKFKNKCKDVKNG